MRRVAVALTLVLAGCSTGPRPAGEQPGVPARPSSPQEPRRLLGLTPTDLIQRFGNPAFQVREGESLKLQFRGQRCTLDAYLYPQNGGLRVEHVDARAPNGLDIDQLSCIAALDQRS